MKCTLIGLVAMLCAVPMLCYSQSAADSSSANLQKIVNFPSRLFKKIDSRTTTLQAQLNKQTTSYLRRLARQEEKVRARLYRVDSAKAAALYSQDPKQQYAVLQQQFQRDSARVFHSMGPEYLPYADSLQGALGFLTKNPGLINANPALQGKMQASLASVQQLQSRLQDADGVQQFVQTRKNLMQQALSGYTHLPSGLSNALAGYKKQAYYYSDQVRAYREALNDPGKLLNTSLALLNKVPAFSNYMKKNGFLAGLFGVPAGYGTGEALNGMQTREQVLGMIQSKIGSGGSSGAGGAGAAALQNSLNAAHQDISKLQNKLSSLGAGSSAMDMPDFKPNQQKTKTLWQRLEYGVTFQTNPTSYFYPTTTNIGLTVGYKLNDANSVGLGASYLVGWGSGFQHIGFSSQGVSLRSFLQLRIKGTFYATGGLEYNYEQPFSSFQDIRSLSRWTPSGLIGVTKTISMKSPVFKKTQVSLLWDLLSYYQTPKTQPIVFRLGYSF